MKNITTFLFFIFTVLTQNAWAQDGFVRAYMPDTFNVSGTPSNLRTRSKLLDLIQTPDSGYLAVGMSAYNSPDNFSANMEGLVLKVNSRGVRQWFKRFSNPNCPAGYNERYFRILSVSDGNFILGGVFSTDTTINHNTLSKITADGVILWQKDWADLETEQTKFYNLDGLYPRKKLLILNDGHILYVTQQQMLKIDANTGATIWQKNVSTPALLGEVGLVAAGFMVARQDSSMVRYNEQGDTVVVLKHNAATNFRLDNIGAIRQLNDGTISVITAKTGGIYLYRFNADLSFIAPPIVQDTNLLMPSVLLNLNYGQGTFVDSDNAFRIYIHPDGKISITDMRLYEHQLYRFDANGLLLASTQYADIGYANFHQYLLPTFDGGLAIAVDFEGLGISETGIIKINSQGYASKTVYIKVYYDKNYNGIRDANELYLCELVPGNYAYPVDLGLKFKNKATGEAKNIQKSSFGLINVYGRISLNDDIYSVYSNLNNLWRIIGSDSFRITSVENVDTITLGIQAAQPCSALEVNIGNDRLRRCTTNVYHVQYTNSGTIAALNAYIDIKLDDFLTFDTATVAAIPLGNNVYRFAVGRVESLESGTLKIHFTVNCTAVMGQMHCTEAVIRPYLECRGDRLWDGSQIQVTAECDAPNHAARFFIKNIGTGDMAAARHWGIIEDDIMGRDSLYLLRAGATDTIRIDSIDSDVIYRIVVEQDPNHPAATVATAVLWCANTVRTHWQFVNQIAQDDGAAYTATNCTANRDSYDPNEKSVTPEGVGEQHAIPKNTPLQYKIQFQNTGNDTAYLVRVHDQLNTNLDWKTLKTGASSHPYTYTLDSTGLLVFTFQNINLLDSTHHEPESHGFVQFTIRQKADLAVGTSLTNTASIYFDFNDPIQTNTVQQTIGAQWATIVQQPTPPTPPIVPVPSPLNVVLVYPNPFSETCYFTLKNQDGKTAITENAMLRLSDITGRIVVEKPFANGQARLERSEIGISTGMLFYQISAEGRLFSVGKLVIAE